jgi:hypothetical protein
MDGLERRANKRYVIDGLLMEIGGVVHETVDVSARAVAVVRRPGIDYKQIKGACRFTSEKGRPLNQRLSSVKYLYERAATVVLEYVILEYQLDMEIWESILNRHDVRADQIMLEDVFG